MNLSSMMNITESAIEKIIEEYMATHTDIHVHVKGIKISFIKSCKEWNWIIPLPDFVELSTDYKTMLIENCVKPALDKILNEEDNK